MSPALRPFLCLTLLAACSAASGPVDRASPQALDSGQPAQDETGSGGTSGDTGAEDEVDTGIPDEEPEPCASVEGRLPRGVEGVFVARDRPIVGARPACTSAWHAAAGAAGSTLSLRLDSTEDGALWVRATDLLGVPLADPTRLAPGEALEIRPAQSGELLLELSPAALGTAEDPPRAYGLSLGCVSGCDIEYSRYPLVFLHGMAGTDSYLGVLDYWYGLDRRFAETGFVIHTPAVDALAGVEDRAVQWLAVLDQLEAEGLGRRFNLVAHSQGGIDARLLISQMDSAGRVASLTTISTPHRGTTLADLADGALDLTPFDGWLVDAALGAMAGLVGLSGPSLSAQMHDMTRDRMARFNAEVFDRPGVSYWSWAGVSCGALDWGCRRERDGEVVDAVFAASFVLMSLVEGDNDGVVGLDSARWGDFLGELPADHMDEVGQIADVYNRSFDAAGFYLDEARRLAAAGL